MGARLKVFDEEGAEGKDHERQHLAHVSAIMFSAYQRHEGNADLPAIQKTLDDILKGTTWLQGSRVLAICRGLFAAAYCTSAFQCGP